MRQVIFIILLLPSLIYSQNITGGSGNCVTDVDPNTMPIFDSQDPATDCVHIYDEVGNKHYRYDASLTIGSRWVASDNGDGIYGMSNMVPSDITATLTDHLRFKDGAVLFTDNAIQIPVAKTHVSYIQSGILEGLRLQNRSGVTDTDGVMMTFSNSSSVGDIQNKAGIGFLKTSSLSRGDLIFSINNLANNDNVNIISDEKMRIKLDGSVVINQEYTLPNIDGGIDQILKTDGSGSLSWQDESSQLNESQVDAFVSNNGYLTTEIDGSNENELQDFDVTDLSGTDLQLSLTDNPTTHTIDLSSIVGDGADGNGLYDGGGTVPSNTTATLTDILRYSGGKVLYSDISTIDPYAYMHVNYTQSGILDAMRIQNRSGVTNMDGVMMTFSNFSSSLDVQAKGAIGFLKTSSLSRGDLIFSLNNEGNSNNVDLFADERFRVSRTGAITFNQAYTFPSTAGTNDQVLKTNGSGILTWSTIDSGDADWHKSGTTTAPTSVSDNIVTSGDVAIGKTTTDTGIGLTIEKNTSTTLPLLRLSQNGTGYNSMHFERQNGGSGSDYTIGVRDSGGDTDIFTIANGSSLGVNRVFDISNSIATFHTNVSFKNAEQGIDETTSGSLLPKNYAYTSSSGDFLIRDISQTTYRATGTNTTATGEDKIIYVNTGGGDRTVTLPVTQAGDSFYIVKTSSDSNWAILNPSGGTLINGTSTYNLTSHRESVHVHFDGTEYWLLSSN